MKYSHSLAMRAKEFYTTAGGRIERVRVDRVKNGNIIFNIFN